jgi:hypothetical protein
MALMPLLSSRVSAFVIPSVSPALRCRELSHCALPAPARRFHSSGMNLRMSNDGENGQNQKRATRRVFIGAGAAAIAAFAVSRFGESAHSEGGLATLLPSAQTKGRFEDVFTDR